MEMIKRKSTACFMLTMNGKKDPPQLQPWLKANNGRALDQCKQI